MNSAELTHLLAPLPISEVRYYDSIGSTNLVAREWIDQGAADMALVVADEQTAGRGRFERRWITRPGSALAFSLITRPTPPEYQALNCLTAWGALAVAAAVDRAYGKQAEIKWPNDVLVNRKKVCGILVEPSWLGNELLGIITGIGVNVDSQSIPPADTVRFPATSLEDEVGSSIDRWILLYNILQEMVNLRPILGSPGFYQAWEDHLAYKGEWVKLSSGYAGDQDKNGIVIGVNLDGSVRLRDSQGREFAVNVGEVHLSPVDPS